MEEVNGNHRALSPWLDLSGAWIDRAVGHLRLFGVGKSQGLWSGAGGMKCPQRCILTARLERAKLAGESRSLSASRSVKRTQEASENQAELAQLRPVKAHADTKACGLGRRPADEHFGHFGLRCVLQACRNDRPEPDSRRNIARVRPSETDHRLGRRQSSVTGALFLFERLKNRR
jgi:hypothetical protein